MTTEQWVRWRELQRLEKTRDLSARERSEIGELEQLVRERDERNMERGK